VCFIHSNRFRRDLTGLATGGTTFGTDATIANSFGGGFDAIPATLDRNTFASPYIAYDRSGGPFHGRLYLAYADERRFVGGTLVNVNESNDFNIFVRFSDDDGATSENLTRSSAIASWPETSPPASGSRGSG